MHGEVTGRASDIGKSLDQHCQEIVVIHRKLGNPKLPDDKRTRLISREPIVRRKIAELCRWFQGG